jgi:hypothetical protein
MYSEMTRDIVTERKLARKGLLATNLTNNTQAQ